MDWMQPAPNIFVYGAFAPRTRSMTWKIWLSARYCLPHANYENIYTFLHFVLNFLTTPRASWHTITTEYWLFHVLSKLAFSVYIDSRRSEQTKKVRFWLCRFSSTSITWEQILERILQFKTFTTCGAFGSYGLFDAKRRSDPFGLFLSFRALLWIKRSHRFHRVDRIYRVNCLMINGFLRILRIKKLFFRRRLSLIQRGVINAIYIGQIKTIKLWTVHVFDFIITFSK